jgi:pimeloyl-ACP methyl ester carboxylesterase
MPPVVVLLHSPLVGPRSWAPVAAVLTGAGHDVRVPSLLEIGAGEPPYWPRAVTAVERELPADGPVVLVAHSNAGLLVPAVAAALGGRVAASVFVDAALPAAADASPAAPDHLLTLLRELAGPDGILPRWTDWWAEEDVAPLFPDPATRREVAAEQPRLPLRYFTQLIPVPAGWDRHPCTYLLFSPAYEETAATAAGRGWTVRRLHGGHLHQLVDPSGVARVITAAARNR